MVSPKGERASPKVGKTRWEDALGVRLREHFETEESDGGLRSLHGSFVDMALSGPPTTGGMRRAPDSRITDRLLSDFPNMFGDHSAGSGLNFLTRDPDHAAAEAYGAWGEKSMYGKKYLGILRSTFVIDEKGRIARVFEKVKPEGHAAQVLEALR